MTEEETKKKKKKTTFDLDAALAQAGTDESVPDTNEKENQEPVEADADDNFDLDAGAKKKKKKKKPFNFEELDGALPDKDDGTINDGTGHDDTGGIDDDFNLDMDFSKTKKKKKKKKDLDELVAEEEKEKVEEKDNDVNLTWSGSDRDYTYDELLTRVFDILRDKNPNMVADKKQKFVMRPPQVVRIGTKKTSFANFTDFCTTLHRQPKHLLDFLLAELGTSGSVDGNSQLIIKGRFQQKQIENVLRRYIKEYVTCHTCRSPDTILRKDTRLFFLQCETCGSRCSVASIKSGFQAVTGKRAAIRAKTA
ncbi:eukaryotic translation initiation factor 2 subunit beta, putative [Pediculus humanus corporis]|uniref:Eukaryotic translation initiation factor 2 subunit 2 n=1 Tax=Pediculus humanus subsp. corporis TaxID=121224 RepID=E0V9R4_PEDHC|nr:eukaryotic translation initiation factor 2 subunit beta, putative [Pediculus humanus corporis]EEB10120.1 eukaryotic translation initiation factor 2 subunit beta, putative [Pediculus humanus corporis]